MARIYISGRMTGLPDYNFPAFHTAAAAWRAAGWEVINPAEAFGGDTERAYLEYVRQDIRDLKTCDAVAVLEGWDDAEARGSVWEVGVAEELLHIPVFLAAYPDTPAALLRPRESALEEAQRLVHGDRAAAYGHPAIDYKATGRMWAATLERHFGFDVPDVPPRIAALMMACVKISREAGRHKRDNNVDLAGYAECVQMIADREAAA